MRREEKVWKEQKDGGGGVKRVKSAGKSDCGSVKNKKKQ